ncbi:MAG: hypothetical protein ACYC6Y_15725, partial [Thermoguttaceae bacterium]
DAEKAPPSDSARLSVAPLSDDNRPDWVGKRPFKQDSVYCWPIAADPSPDPVDAEEQALPKALDTVVADYIRTRLQLGSAAASQVRLPPDFLRTRMVGDDVWAEPLALSVGDFVRIHALVKFDHEVNEAIAQQWRHLQMTGRLWAAAGILALVLALMALVYCYLKIDQVTRGSRRGLLRMAALLVILGLILVAAGVAAT